MPSADELTEPRVDGAVPYRLDLAVTELRPLAWWHGWNWAFSPTSVPLLWFAWTWYWLSAGHGWMQVEGVLRHEGRIRPVLAFVHRARYDDTFDFRFFRRPDAEVSVEALCAESALAILKELHNALSESG